MLSAGALKTLATLVIFLTSKFLTEAHLRKCAKLKCEPSESLCMGTAGFAGDPCDQQSCKSEQGPGTAQFCRDRFDLIPVTGNMQSEDPAWLRSAHSIMYPPPTPDSQHPKSCFLSTPLQGQSMLLDPAWKIICGLLRLPENAVCEWPV